MDETTERAIRRFLRVIGKKYDVADAYLFGSRARGTHQPDSDADVAVVLNGSPQRFLDTTLDMTDVAYEIFVDTGIDISPLPIWQEEWDDPEGYPTPRLLKAIAADGIRL